MTDVVVLRFGELFLKGANRSQFEKKLHDGARRALASVPSAKVHKMHGRVLIEVDAVDVERATARLGRVFGVQSLSPARLVEKDLEAISAEAVRTAGESLAKRGGKKFRFKVETRRSDKTFPMGSTDVSREVGGRIFLAYGLPVDVNTPEVTIGVEIGVQRTFVFADVLPGPGGLPTGASGHVNLLLSGGIDSPVAGWLAMKRGCTLSATYFHSFPYTGDKTKEKVIDLVKLLVPWHGPITLNVVGFTEVQKALRAAGAAELAVVLYRRMMMRAAARVAAREHAIALVTGDNLAQVASQTLENLSVIEEACAMPILRPLLCNDKIETVVLAKRIGTFETSILPYEDCCGLFVPAHPATRARLSDVHEAEARLTPHVDVMAAELAEHAERLVIT